MLRWITHGSVTPRPNLGTAASGGPRSQAGGPSFFQIILIDSYRTVLQLARWNTALDSNGGCDDENYSFTSGPHRQRRRPPCLDRERGRHSGTGTRHHDS